MSTKKTDIGEYPYAGIKSMHDLTKEELITCIKYVFERDHSAKFWFERRVLDIADKRARKKLEEDEAKGDRWINLQKEYEALLKPYRGRKISEIPANVIEKGAALEKEIKIAQEEYFATFG